MQPFKVDSENKKIYCSSMDSVVGKIFIAASRDAILHIFFHKEVKSEFLQYCRMARNQLIIEAELQLYEYFQSRRVRFDLPLHFQGTLFQEKVWKEIAEIPHGVLVTYGDIAGKLGNRNLARAVGRAANRNPLPIIIPCHRIVGSGGGLVGFAPGVELKQILIDHERATL